MMNANAVVRKIEGNILFEVCRYAIIEWKCHKSMYYTDSPDVLEWNQREIICKHSLLSNNRVYGVFWSLAGFVERWSRGISMI